MFPQKEFLRAQRQQFTEHPPDCSGLIISLIVIFDLTIWHENFANTFSLLFASNSPEISVYVQVIGIGEDRNG